ncbi:MAG: hypothetical protein Kow00124_25170 [Anaerolineae bacterium]
MSQIARRDGAIRWARLALRLAGALLVFLSAMTYVQQGVITAEPPRFDLMTLPEVMLFIGLGLMIVGAIVVWTFDLEGGILMALGALICVVINATETSGLFVADFNLMVLLVGLLSIGLAERRPRT